MRAEMPGTARGRAVSTWLLALLLVLHAAAPIAVQLPSKTLRPLLAALVPDGGPILRPFGFTGQIASIRSETRSLAGPPDRVSEQDPGPAILPIAVALWDAATAKAPQPNAGIQFKHTEQSPFEARAPPTIA